VTDTGPPYPPLGPNGIGQFVIGVSPIGDIPFDYRKTIISQYANSPILTALINNDAAYLLQTENLDAFFDDIWNVLTAQGYGLDVWGRIVGVSRTLQITVGDWFGFDQGVPGADTFGQGSFFSGQALTDSFQLADDPYRRLILAKAAANITNGSIPAINQILLSLFPGRGNCYVTDDGDMTMTYTFDFPLSPVELAIVQNSGVLPKPVGVSASVVLP